MNSFKLAISDPSLWVVESEMFEMILADPFCFGASFQELVQITMYDLFPRWDSLADDWPDERLLERVMGGRRKAGS
ncbi:hypothetical protein NC653_034118 [Populus alba x Populus x berolinensis]|uniref:Uncharacterized protein n=1 Tax=Populus alba x Populus x berolinensis TaxID=444605 RepID=A0AAD6LLT2_9ROSI|nr:hypothetical protein NC653_034118 [Populus alba x Populus x berolinensis]